MERFDGKKNPSSFVLSTFRLLSQSIKRSKKIMKLFLIAPYCISKTFFEGNLVSSIRLSPFKVETNVCLIKVTLKKRI